MSFCERLKTMRLKNGFSQIDMAQKMGVARETYRSIEFNKIPPTLDRMVLMAEILKVDVVWLAFGDDRNINFGADQHMIDWNQANKLHLIEKINRETLHPLGLALCCDPTKGISPGIVVSPNGKWIYPDTEPMLAPTDNDVRKIVKKIIEEVS